MSKDKDNGKEKRKLGSKFRELWEHLRNKDKPKTPETPPPKEEAPAVVALESITVVGAGSGDPVLPMFAVGKHKQFSAEGLYTDRSTKDLTATVVWKSSPSKVVSIDAKGKATGRSAGDAIITAEASGVSGSRAIKVTGAVKAVKPDFVIAIKPENRVFSPKQRHDYQATAVYSDGATRDITDAVEWDTNDHDVAMMAKKICFTRNAGTATITATDPKTGVSGSTSVEVEAKPAK